MQEQPCHENRSQLRYSVPKHASEKQKRHLDHRELKYISNPQRPHIFLLESSVQRWWIIHENYLIIVIHEFFGIQKIRFKNFRGHESALPSRKEDSGRRNHLRLLKISQKRLKIGELKILGKRPVKFLNKLMYFCKIYLICPNLK